MLAFGLGAFRSLSASYAIRDIASARSTGRTVVLTFKSERKANETENSFDFDGSDENAAHGFADRINALIVGRR